MPQERAVSLVIWKSPRADELWLAAFGSPPLAFSAMAERVPGGSGGFRVASIWRNTGALRSTVSGACEAYCSAARRRSPTDWLRSRGLSTKHPEQRVGGRG